MSEPTDEFIMKQVRDGNLAELSVLFERYHVRLYNFMLKLTFDREASHDLTQNLFYRVLKYRHTYRDEHTFKSWIYKMARNIHMDYCKQQLRTTEHLVPVESRQQDIAEQAETFTEEEYNRLDRALAQLNPHQKEIIVLSRFQGLKYEEISGIVDSSVPAIKVQMHRALKQLRIIYFNLI